MKKELLDPQIVALDKGGAQRDMSVLEDNDIAFDPTKVTIDLTKDEKRRTTALMLAIQAYDHLIIKDAEMFSAISRESARGNGPVIQPATMNAMVEAAINFDAFIAGSFSRPLPTAEKDESVQSTKKEGEYKSGFGYQRE